jgi:5-methylcytosine-specific restriction endonuclease McrA
MENGSEWQWVECPYCGEKFETRWGDRKKYCSEEHRWADHRRRKKQKEEGVYHVDFSSDQTTPTKCEGVRRFPAKRAPQGHKCEVCGFHGDQKLGIRVTQHHIVPRSLGGKTEDNNLIWLCHPCHDWAELFASEARSREEFFTLVRLNYPWPDMSTPKYDPDKVQCRLHGDFRKWVYGGTPAPPWGCTCKKRKTATTAGSDIDREPTTKGSAVLGADGSRGMSDSA